MFRASKEGLLAWDVDKLIEDSSNLLIKKVVLTDIRELDECFWYDLGGSHPTCRNIVEHAKLIQETDLQYPIILSKDGRVMDGMHRVCKALLKGLKTIKAVQFNNDIPPDFVGINPEQLPYD
ncbi:MAG: hypothetical protein P1U36_06115 [Legionellaceae bacterium]|nr:hypothetical protein [Legionellaceae bacterium]